MDLKIQLVRLFGWSLVDIDHTDIQSLMPFIDRLEESGTKGIKSKHATGKEKSVLVYCDTPEASWL